MKAFYLTFIAALFFFTSCTKEDKQDFSPLSQALKQTISNSNEFGFNLLREIHQQEDAEKNVFVSPLSISMALGMTLNGAKGQTYTDMQKTLAFSGMDPQEINESYKSLLDLLPDIDKQVLMRIANSIWYNNQYEILPEFIKTNSAYFDAKIEGLSFADGEAAKNMINDWVAQNTENRIKDLVSGVTTDDIMLLVNAVYFLADWRYQFDKDKTTPRYFHLADGSTELVDMMRSEEVRFNYFNNGALELVNLPYGNGSYSFTALMPSGQHSLDVLIEQLTSEKLQLWLSQADNKHKLPLSLPKFEMEYEIQLNEVLSAMGMEIAFNSSAADFSGMNPFLPLFISEVMHKTYIRLDEEGTEAAAATSVTVSLESMPPEVTLNRPFLFLIHEKNTGAVLFMGKMMNPAA